jgi:hypothetical protein
VALDGVQHGERVEAGDAGNSGGLAGPLRRRHRADDGSDRVQRLHPGPGRRVGSAVGRELVDDDVGERPPLIKGVDQRVDAVAGEQVGGVQTRR